MQNNGTYFETVLAPVNVQLVVSAKTIVKVVVVGFFAAYAARSIVNAIDQNISVLIEKENKE